ncbi:MAG: hypothetical protein ABSH50_11150 [Bryobacteraceae bacterium]|jgi:hypothetical protein
MNLALVTILASTAAVASANTVFKGTFDLPENAYWGNTLLPAGQYAFSVIQQPTGTSLIRLQGSDVNAMVLGPAGGPEAHGINCLKLEEVNGMYVVRELDTRVTGISFRFAVSKAVRNRVETESSNAWRTVPVSGF